MSWAGGFVLVTLGACSPATWGHADDFQDRLKAGCHSLEQCQTLQLAAEARAERCGEDSAGSVPCRDAAGDLRVARAYVGAWQGKAAEEQAEREKAQAEHEKQKRRAAQEEALVERLRGEDARQSDDETCRQGFNAQVAQHVAADPATRQAREVQLAYLRLLSPASRARKLSDCYSERRDCWDTVQMLLEAAGSNNEKQSIAELNERLLHQPRPATAARPSQAATR